MLASTFLGAGCILVGACSINMAQSGKLPGQPARVVAMPHRRKMPIKVNSVQKNLANIVSFQQRCKGGIAVNHGHTVGGDQLLHLVELSAYFGQVLYSRVQGIKKWGYGEYDLYLKPPGFS